MGYVSLCVGHLNAVKHIKSSSYNTKSASSVPPGHSSGIILTNVERTQPLSTVLRVSPRISMITEKSFEENKSKFQTSCQMHAMDPLSDPSLHHCISINIILSINFNLLRTSWHESTDTATLRTSTLSQTQKGREEARGEADWAVSLSKVRGLTLFLWQVLLVYSQRHTRCLVKPNQSPTRQHATCVGDEVSTTRRHVHHARQEILHRQQAWGSSLGRAGVRPQSVSCQLW